MINRVQVFYEGWNERWHWGTLATSTNPLVRPFYQNARKTPPFRAGRMSTILRSQLDQKTRNDTALLESPTLQALYVA